MAEDLSDKDLEALAGIVHEIQDADFRARVAGKHRLPENDHVQLRVRVSAEDVLSDPTGADATGGSGWGEQDTKRRLPGSGIERSLQLPDVPQLRRRRGLARAGAGARVAAAAATRRQEQEHDRQRKHSPPGRHRLTVSPLGPVDARQCWRRLISNASATAAAARVMNGVPCRRAKLSSWPE